MRTIRPLLDRVLIKQIEATNGSSIIMTGGSEKLKQLHGVVVAVGAGRLMANGKQLPLTSVAVGDKVVYGNMGTNIVEYVGVETYVLVQEIGIVAVLEDDE